MKKIKRKNFNLTNIILITLIIIIAIVLSYSLISGNKNYKIVVTQNSVVINDTDTYQINASIEPSNSDYYINKYVSNNPLVATVDNTGLVTPVSSGIVTILIYSNNNLTNSVLITINKTKYYPTSISFVDKNITLKKDEEVDLNYILEPSNCNFTDVTITSSNPSVVEVNDKKIKAISDGESTITIKTVNDLSDTLLVTVKSDVESINFNEQNYSLDITDKLKLEYSILPEDASDKTVTFESSNENIVKVDSEGNIEGIGKGSATITIKSINGITSTTNIEVKENLIKMFPSLKTVKSGIDGTVNSSINLEYTDTSILLYGSDYQGGNRESNFKSILNTINTKISKPNLITLVGDYYSNGTNDNSKQVLALGNIIHSYSNFSKVPIMFTAGNHDKKGTKYLVTTGGYISNNYAVYDMNLYDNPRVTGSCTGSNKTNIDNITNNLKAFLEVLKEKNVKSPIIVANHLPLHYSSRYDNRCEGNVLNVLNEYGKYLNIVYLFGHNHSGQYDNCLGGSINTILKGGQMQTYDSSGNKTTVTINFTYMNAGYIGYSANKLGTLTCNGTSITSTNIVTMGYFEINNDKMIIKRYGSSTIYNVTEISLK